MKQGTGGEVKDLGQKETSFSVLAPCFSTDIVRKGENKNLGLTVSQYRNPVACNTAPIASAPDFDSCQWILSRLPAGGATSVFGKRGLPTIDPGAGLPLTLASRE